MLFCKVHSIGPINVCTNFEINQYKIDEFRKHAKIVCFMWRHVTQKRYVVCHGGSGSFWKVFFSLETFCNQPEISTTYSLDTLYTTGIQDSR